MDDRTKVFWVVTGTANQTVFYERVETYPYANELARAYTKKYNSPFTICESVEIVAPKGTFTGKVMPITEV